MVVRVVRNLLLCPVLVSLVLLGLSVLLCGCFVAAFFSVVLLLGGLVWVSGCVLAAGAVYPPLPLPAAVMG